MRPPIPVRGGSRLNHVPDFDLVVTAALEAAAEAGIDTEGLAPLELWNKGQGSAVAPESRQ